MRQTATHQLIDTRIKLRKLRVTCAKLIRAMEDSEQQAGIDRLKEQLKTQIEYEFISYSDDDF